MTARARVALAVALLGIVLGPLLANAAGDVVAVGTAAVFAAIGIALFPESY